jgi:parvulin-like peptidyl-prolyl isomerase
MDSKHLAAVAIFSSVFILAGCGSSKHLPAPLKPQAFQPKGKAAEPPTAAAPIAKPHKDDATAAIDPLDPQNYDLSPTASAPTTRPVLGLSSGSFMHIGAVVAEVNGQPIYADKILAKVDAELSAKAPLLEPREFRLAAESALKRQLEHDIALEREFAAAQRNTTAEEQQRATLLATAWRQREIIKAGGSLAVARRISLERDGIDFEERVKEQYQAYMILIYIHGRVEPRVQVSGDDMRRFYDQNIEHFTDKAGVRFRAIRIGAKEMGSREYALKEVESIIARAKRGDDFAKLCVEKNHDPVRLANEGWWMTDEVVGETTKTRVPRWIERGTLKLEQIEKAAFELEVGEVTQNPIDTGDAFWIVKLEQKQKGRVRPFEDPDVQAEIRRQIGGAQRTALRMKEFNRLAKGSILRSDQKMFETTVDMAMQKYYAWSRANRLTRAGDPQQAPASR